MADMLRGGTRTWWDLADLYGKFLGRPPTQQELQGWGQNIDEAYFQKIANSLANTEEGKAWEQKQLNGQNNQGQGQTQSAQQGGGSDKERIDAMLQAVQSTDDPEYWYKIARDHGGLDATGVGWMQDRINRGDGSMLVRSGQLSKFQDGNGYGNLMGDYKPFDEQFSFDAFKAPDSVSEANDPGFDAALKNIKDTLEHSAGARGSLLSGNTKAALVDRAGQFTLGEYQNLFNRELTGWNANQQEKFNEYNQRRLNHDNQFGQLFALQNAATGRDQFDRNLSSQNQQFRDSLASQNQNALNNLNLNYANLGSGLIQNGVGQANNYFAGGENAAAAGTVGSNNAYSSLFGNLSQIPWYIQMLRNQRGGQ